MKKDTEDIKKSAKAFRKAMEVAHEEGVFRGNPLLERFPNGSCGGATDLICEYLLNTVDGIDSLYYVCGTHYPATGDEERDFNERQSHAWISIGDPLDSDSIVVDITGDQDNFSGSPEYGYHDIPVYVGKRNIFYRLFEVDDRDVHECHGIRDYDPATQGGLFRLYDEIVKRIRWD